MPNEKDSRMTPADAPKANGDELRVIGVPRRRVDARAKVTGQTRFADDIFLPRMAYCKLLRSPHPHARIRKIDTSRASAHPGVYLVLTGKDVPIQYGILPVSQDEQALCVDRVRHVGDPVAAVIAREELTAFEALDLIDVDYEILATISDPEEALATPEPRIHEYGEEGNIHKFVALEFGNVGEGFAEADEIFEDTFFFQGSTHLPIEQHASVAIRDPDGKLTIWSSTQTPHYLHRALAKVLEIPAAHIRVIATPNGGGFGGKSDPFNHEIVVAKAALMLDLPRYLYQGCRTFTNKPPCGPKRGHGTPQPRFGQEVQLDKIAEKLKIDPADLRLRIVESSNAVTANFFRLGTVNLAECIRRIVKVSGWKEKFRKLPDGRGVGLACSAYLTGAGLPIYWNKMPHSGVQLKFDRSGGVSIFCGATEIGQGSDDVLAGIVAEVLGIDTFDIRLFTGDTDLGPVDLGSYSSRVTLMAGNAALQAAERGKAIIADAVAEKLEVPKERLRFAGKRVFDSATPEMGFTFQEAVCLAEARFGTIGTEALMEEQEFRRLPKKLSHALVHKYPSILEYKSPTSLDMPDVITELIEEPDPRGPFGAKEVGQGPLLPIMPAVANAVYDAVGVRIDEIPVTPEKIMKALSEKKAGRDPRFGPSHFPQVNWPEALRVPPPWEGGDGNAVNDVPRREKPRREKEKVLAP